LTDRQTYALRFATAVKSDVRKLDKQLQSVVQEEHLTSIESDPYKATPLLHEFRGLWSYHFAHKGTQYRVIYEVYTEERIVLVVMIGSREKLYEALRRRVR